MGKIVPHPVVAFAGMTHLGLVLATAVASAGYETVCFDKDAALVARLKKHDLPVVEPDLPALLKSNGRRQTFTSSVSDIRGCDVVYVAPDISTDGDGRSDTTSLTELIDLVVPAMGPNAVLVVLSQVDPGFTRTLPAPPPERLYYQVETLVFGRAVQRATKPERYIIGCADPDRPSMRTSGRFLKPSNARSCQCATKAPNWRRFR